MAEIVSLSATRILLVEDSASDAALITAWLEEVGHGMFTISRATSIAAALPMLGEQAFHAILLDMTLPDTVELDGFLAIQNMAPTLPIIILTGRNDEKLALKAVESGAQDYLMKDKAQGSILRVAIHYGIQRKRFEDGITRLANFDKLTGLANRVLFESKLDMALARAQRSHTGLGLFLLDLNEFKQVNDTYGHAAGDHLLRETGGRIARCLRPYDTAARLGGDEFAVLVEGIGEPRDCVTVAQKLLEGITQPVPFDGKELRVGVSIGIATCLKGERCKAPLLMKHADEAMYRSKDKHESTYHFYTPDMDEALRMRVQLENDLRKAVQHDQLTLCYQPKQTLADGLLGGVEALVRWNHPLYGLLLPGEFMSLATGTPALDEIEEWVLMQVCQDLQRWRTMELPLIPVSVNVSARRFSHPDFIPHLTSLMKRHNVPEGQLALELPESVFAATHRAHAEIFIALYKLGILITMDKFGGELSSLQALKHVTLSEIKFDSALSHTGDTRLMHAIIACAHALGVKVGALGVESEELRDCLKELNCDAIQGFIFSRPMPAAYLEEWLQSNSPPTYATLPSHQPSRHPASLTKN